MKLNHFQSAHDQLFDVASYGSIAFARKYSINGPVPESLTNYLDVRKICRFLFDFSYKYVCS